MEYQELFSEKNKLKTDQRVVTFCFPETLFNDPDLKIPGMPQSLTQIYVHIVFSTKYRQPMILPAIEAELYQYLTNQCNLAGCIALEVGGHKDHVHILCRLSKHITIPKFLEKIKGTSSRWIKTRSSEFTDFYWQDGYGAFSISARELDGLIAYIRNQHKHHTSKSFEEEYLEILDQYKVEYDQRYLWD